MRYADELALLCASFRELLERTARGLESGTIVAERTSSGKLRMKYLSPRAKKPVSIFTYFA